MKANNLIKIGFLLSSEDLLIKNAISPCYFYICNILKRIDEKEDLEENFYLMLVERSIISFYKQFSEKRELSNYFNLLEKMLITNCSCEKVIEYKRIFEDMKKRCVAENTK